MKTFSENEWLRTLLQQTLLEVTLGGHIQQTNDRSQEKGRHEIQEKYI